jgi:hypothetical protein
MGQADEDDYPHRYYPIKSESFKDYPIPVGAPEILMVFSRTLDKK